MASNIQRFTILRTSEHSWIIKDNSDNTAVCFIHQGRRELAKTQAMVKVMLDALNAAASLPSKAEH